MATCKFSTYQTNLTPARNALVDDIATYLHTDCGALYTNTEFHYLQMALDMEVTLPFGQSDVVLEQYGNYAEIVIDGKTWYYFITKCEWASTKAVKLTLSIDSINTFRADLEWGPQTTIERQHEDRLVMGAQDSRIYRLIDPVPEDVTIIKRLENKTKLIQNESDINWYLIYDAELSVEDESRPVRCRLIADRALIVYKSSSTGPAQTWTSSDIGSGQYYYMTSNDNDLVTLNMRLPLRNAYNTDTWGNRDISIGDSIIVDGPRESVVVGTQTLNQYTYWRGVINGFRVSASGGNVIVALGLRDVTQGTQLSFRPAGLHWPGTYATAPDFVTGGLNSSFTSITVKQLSAYRHSTNNTIPIAYSSYVIPDTDKVSVSIGSLVTRTTLAFEDVDRTDSRLIKIINLPYAPCEVSYDPDSGVYTFPAEWIYEDGYMRLTDNNLSKELSSTVGEINLTNDLIYSENYSFSVTDSRRLERESKLYNSQFSTYKLVYDSFVTEVPLENFHYYDLDTLGVNAAAPLTFTVTFKPSNTVNSHFLFFSDLDTLATQQTNIGDACEYLHYSDYDEYMIVTRNNEESIFSSAYLNYIRNGYNYDKKVKADQNAWNLAMGGIQTAGAIVSFAAGAVTGGVSVAAGVALTTSAISTFAGAAHNDAVNNASIEQKLKELQMQGVTVSGADDINLLKFYGGNKAWWVKYGTSLYQRQACFDLFHYCGYKHPAHAVPVIDSRFWFNFIQCDPVFSNADTFVWNNYLDDIRTRYRAGVTVYHRHPGFLADAYDWSQSHENWEVSFARGLLTINVTVTPTPYDEQYDVNGIVAESGPLSAYRVDIEYYWDIGSWDDKDPDDSIILTIASDGTFSDTERAQGMIAIRARVRNIITGKTYPWSIWESDE